MILIKSVLWTSFAIAVALAIMFLAAIMWPLIIGAVIFFAVYCIFKHKEELTDNAVK